MKHIIKEVGLGKPKGRRPQEELGEDGGIATGLIWTIWELQPRTQQMRQMEGNCCPWD